jgi:hypothetical protein
MPHRHRQCSAGQRRPTASGADLRLDTNTPPVTNGLIKTGSSSNGAQPVGSTGNYYTVGPSTNSPGTVDISSFLAPIGSLSLIWGSVDTYNTLQFIGATNNVLATFTGTQIINSNFGNQVLPGSNPFVTFNVTGADQFLIRGLRLTSTQEAFEIDNITIGAVPEPGTWALMLLGFGFVGASLRSRKNRDTVRVRYAI